MEDLNPQSIQILMDMGYELSDILLALRALRDSSQHAKRGYNPVGEVQKAIDWLNDFLVKQEQLQLKEFERQAKLDQVAEQMNVKSAMTQSAKPLKQEKKLVEERKVEVNINKLRLSQVYSWGNGLQG